MPSGSAAPVSPWLVPRATLGIQSGAFEHGSNRAARLLDYATTNTATASGAGDAAALSPNIRSFSQRSAPIYEGRMSDPTREEIAAQIRASEAGTETKIARLEGKLDLVLESVRTSRDEARDNRRAVIANGWVIFGALVVVLGIMLTIAPTIFDMGFRWRETLTQEVKEVVQRSQPPLPPPRPPATNTR
jgi:hypothetical protein